MATNKQLAIVLLGPTASGKTETALDLAAQFNLVDIRKPNEPITLKEFQEEAQSSLNKALQEKGMALLVGGSGLYLKAITSGLRPPAVPPNKDLRQQLSDLGQAECFQLLKSSDPKASSRIAAADSVRTQRALEVLYATGLSITEQEGSDPPPWEVLELGLNPINLRQRIANRTNQIYANGLIEETQQLITEYSKELPLLQTIGYGEALKVIQGEFTMPKAIEVTNRRTNQFAKRQRTWFRRQHNPKWLNNEEPLKEALSLIKAALR